METKSIQLKTLFAAVFSVLVLEIVSTHAGIHTASKLAVTGIVRLIDILILTGSVFFLEGTLSVIGIAPPETLTGLRKGALWSITFGFLAALVALGLLAFGNNPFHLIRMALPESKPEVILFFLIGGIISPVAEEILFRGLIYRFFRRWGFLFALCFSTLIFAALHPMSSGVPVFQIVGGMLFATAFEIEKNLVVPTVIHILGNLAIFSISLLTN